MIGVEGFPNTDIKENKKELLPYTKTILSRINKKELYKINYFSSLKEIKELPELTYIKSFVGKDTENPLLQFSTDSPVYMFLDKIHSIIDSQGRDILTDTSLPEAEPEDQIHERVSK